nr:polyprenyl diphosphate synthase [Polaromonas sp. UBA4122]
MSVTQFPVSQPIPQHIAIIMDGNRRWAKQFGMPAALGHANGARRVRSIVQACADRGVRFITLFAFSTENWQRPPDEVSSLMGLLALYLRKEVSDMNAKGVRLKVVGDTSDFDVKIQALIRDAQEKTAHNDTITLTIAANYGGRWDVVQAVKSWQAAHPGEPVDAMDEASLAAHLGLAYAPDPDLLIRTGGESRISNFMLWQLAYTEMFFTDVLWPSFTADELDQAIAWYGMRDRRFGGTSTLSVVKA